MTTAIALIPFWPLLGFLINILFGKRLRSASAYLAIGMLALSFLTSVAVFTRFVGDPASVLVPLFSWMSVGALNVEVNFLVDQLTVVMLLVVTGVGTLIHVYSVGYMHGDERYSRFFAYMNLFAAMMLVLVLADNYVVMFVGWECVGLCSYLLIGFWFERPFGSGTTNDAARKAFIVNRVGDFGFLLGVFLIWTAVGGVSFQQTNSAVESGYVTPGVATIATLLLFIGATGKSAQIPLYVWLPDAMAGPTPVSALIHAATMVTAGVYMVARSHFLFDIAPFSQNVVLWVGALTALFAASMGVQENDIKKILAYSTISQLGYMFMGVGAGAYAAGVFHLMTHAFFKALLFLGAGAVIHALHGEQDITRMGGLRNRMPLVHGTFLIGALALAGFPLTAGFFSKDSVLAGVYAHGDFAVWCIGVLTAGVTAFYTFRLYFLVFSGSSRDEKGRDLHAPASSMTSILLLLAILSLVGGYVELPFHILDTFSAFLSPVVGMSSHEGIPELALMTVVFLFVLGGIGVSWAWYGRREQDATALAAEPANPFLRTLRRKWYVDEIYEVLLIRPIRWTSRTVLWRVIDEWIIHGFLVQFCGGYLWKAIGFVVSFSHTGRVGSYAFGIVVGVLVIISLIAR
ncbi:MAG TPA: NADH-quinone oxidoreductase subunit L [Candidatus Latescibacteria bacterium]|nr:NADH-quinone oxidoreductase subunit L [Candidatus Latescibacterota bacterium]